MKIRVICIVGLAVGLLSTGMAEERSPEYGIITESTPSVPQYFSWINNTNEGSTEEQTLINLEFFKWLYARVEKIPDNAPYRISRY